MLVLIRIRLPILLLIRLLILLLVLLLILLLILLLLLLLILLRLPQVNHSVGPHRVRVPARGFPYSQLRVLKRTRRWNIGHRSCTPKRCHTSPQHSLPGDARLPPEPYLGSCAPTGFGPRWATARRFVAFGSL